MTQQHGAEQGVEEQEHQGRDSPIASPTLMIT